MTTSVPPTPGPLSLLDFPIELIRSITGHLSQSSAVALALTCRQLREAAESVIWHHLFVTDRATPPRFPSAPSPTLAQAYIPSSILSAPPRGVFTLPSPSASHALIDTLLTYLSAQPWRATQLRTLILDLRHELPASILDVLTLCTGLEHLELRSPGPSFTVAPYALTATLDLFRSLPSPLPSLLHLRLEVRYRWNETLVEIVEKVPNLEVLHILSHPRRISGGVPPIRSKLIPWGTLPRLRELIVDEMEQSFVPTLTPLIQAALRLEAVALRDHAHRWKPTPECPLLTALAEKETLRRLECTYSCFPFFLAPGAFENLESLSMLWSTNLAFGPTKTEPIIPALPNLQQYQLDISLYTSSSDMDLHRHMLVLSSIASDILTRASRTLHSCPKLTTVYLPPHLDYHSRADEICPPAPDPHGPAFTGMVVQTYSDPSDSGPSVTHYRSKITTEYPLMRRPEGWAEPYDDGTGNWQEGAMREDGSTLPVSVLAAMCWAGGVKMGRETLSREGVLPAVSWNVLRCWELRQEWHNVCL